MTPDMLISAVAFAILLCWFFSSRSRERDFQGERDAWAEERKDLLDRIQAPTFTDYANKVVREKKAAQPPVEPEQMPEFIS